ncbi:hypothetical protein D8749_RS16805 [Escherichia coli]|nr:hypothetical protein [Escherichia coli]
MLDLFKAIGLGLVVLLPLANPLTTVAFSVSLTLILSRVREMVNITV